MLTSRFFQTLLIGAAVANAGAAAFGQSAPPAPSDSKPSEAEQTVTMSPFEVNASTDRGYTAGNEISATRISTGINDLPFTISAFTPQYIADIGAQNLMDVASQSAGVKSAINNNTQGNASFTIRGFVQSPQRNGYSSNQLTTNNVDGSVLERVEVVKGPSSLLYGAISPGGTVNYITKQAQEKPIEDLQFFVGSFDYEGVSLDVNRAVIPNKLLFRLVTTYENNERYVDYTKGNTLVVYPTVKYIIGPKVTLTVDYQWFHERETPPAMYLANTDLANPTSIVAGLNGTPGNPAGASMLANKTGPAVAQGVSDVSDPGFMLPMPAMGKTFNASDINDLRLNDLQTIEAVLDVKLTDNWNFRGHYSADVDRSTFKETGHATIFLPPPNSLVYTKGAWAVAPSWAAMTPAQQIAQSLAYAQQAVNDPNLLDSTQNGTPSPAMMDRAPRIQEQWLFATTLQAEAVGTYNLPWVSLELLGGTFYDSAHYNLRTTQNKGTAASPFFRDWDVNPASPTYYVNHNEGGISHTSLTTVNTYTTAYNADEAAYGLINASFFNQRLYVVGGARYNVSESQIYDHVAQVASPGLRAHYTTPQVGVGYKIVPDVMVYASYSESYTLSTQPFLTTLGNVNGIPTAVPTTATSPTIGKGYETGIKANLLDNTLTTTVSVYKIQETNVLQALNQNIQGTGVVLWSQGATQTGKGVEATINWAPMKNWQIVFSASEEDIRNTAEPFGLSYYLGQNVGYTAKTMANLWTRYDLTSSGVPGLWVGGGVDYTGKSAGDPRNAAFYLPAFTLYNAAVGFDWHLGKSSVTTALNFKNIGNTAYKPSPNSVGEPQRFLLSCTLHY